jgi:hypothetical protein
VPVVDVVKPQRSAIVRGRWWRRCTLRGLRPLSSSVFLLSSNFIGKPVTNLGQRPSTASEGYFPRKKLASRGKCQMSAMPNEPYRAKKLQASERDQQNHNLVVLASAIEIIVVITSLIGARLMASKHARIQAVLALIAALCLASPVTNAAAADITVSSADKSGRIFVDVSGDIAVGDEKTFGEKTANLDADHTYVSLVSDGGNSIAGGSMGDIIRFRGMNTYVPPNATCASICAFIWLAGSAKFVANSSHIGVHGAYNAHTLQPSNETNMLLAVYLAQLGYNYDDALWMLMPPPGNMHWLTSENAKEHHIYWAELSPTREQSPLYNYLPPAPSPPDVSRPRSRPVAQYTAADNLNLRSGPRSDVPSALAKDEYIPAGAIILAWQEELCRPREDAVKPYASRDFWCPVYYKKTKGWVNAYYLLTSDGARLGERFSRPRG